MMTILAFLLAILILVGFHEFGHYITAKFCGIIVERFSIGFGPVLWKKTPKNPFDTEFVLSAIPLGGYVKLLDSKERSDLSAEQSGKAFDQQVLWKRSLVVAAGPFANFLLAWVLLSALFLSNPMQVKPILDEPNANTIAAMEGVEAGDEVRGFALLDANVEEQAVNFEDIPSWNRLRWKLLRAIFSGEGFALEVDHESKGVYRIDFPKEKIQSLNMEQDLFEQLGLKMRRSTPMATFRLETSFFQALTLASDRVYDITVVSIMSIRALVLGEVSFSQISGPIGIANMAGQSAQSGLIPYLGFLALISISLGLMNLLPLPMLDGGQLVFDFWEFIYGKGVSADFKAIAVKFGLGGILILTGIAVFNDLARLFHG